MYLTLHKDRKIPDLGTEKHKLSTIILVYIWKEVKELPMNILRTR